MVSTRVSVQLNIILTQKSELDDSVIRLEVSFHGVQHLNPNTDQAGLLVLVFHFGSDLAEYFD